MDAVLEVLPGTSRALVNRVLRLADGDVTAAINLILCGDVSAGEEEEEEEEEEEGDSAGAAMARSATPPVIIDDADAFPASGAATIVVDDTPDAMGNVGRRRRPPSPVPDTPVAAEAAAVGETEEDNWLSDGWQSVRTVTDEETEAMNPMSLEPMEEEDAGAAGRATFRRSISAPPVIMLSSDDESHGDRRAHGAAGGPSIVVVDDDSELSSSSSSSSSSSASAQAVAPVRSASATMSTLEFAESALALAAAHQARKRAAASAFAAPATTEARASTAPKRARVTSAEDKRAQREAKSRAASEGKQALREAKAQLREAKAREKQQAKEDALVRREFTRKSRGRVVGREVSIVFEQSLALSEWGGEMRHMLASDAHEFKHWKTVRMPPDAANVVYWDPRNRFLDEDEAMRALAERRRMQQANSALLHACILLKSDAFFDLLERKSSQADLVDGLGERIHAVRQALAPNPRVVTLVLVGVRSELRRREAAARRQQSPQKVLPAAAGGTDVIAARRRMEKRLMDLQLSGTCVIRHVPGETSASRWITSMSASIGNAPYRNVVDEDSLSTLKLDSNARFYMDGDDSDDQGDMLSRAEIGRASCRERV